MKWTAEMHAHLAELWAEGKTCRQIAAAFGPEFTKSQIIGQAYRCKLPPRVQRGADAYKSRSTDDGRGHKPTLAAAHAPQPRSERLPVALKAPEAVGLPLVPKGAGNAILGLQRGQCRWPEGEPNRADFHFCGAPIAGEGKSYCQHHAARAVVR